MEKSESIKEIAKALCEFQKSVGKIPKSETNPFFKSKYAGLPDILNAIRQPLTDNGLSFLQFPENECELTTLLLHVSGEFFKSSYIMKPVKNDPQGIGSVITYQRRYALGSILGLNIDDDDDGNKGSETDKKSEVKKLDLKEKSLELAVNEMSVAKDLESMKNIWTKWKAYQTEQRFIQAKDLMKKKFETPAPPETEIRLLKPKSENWIVAVQLLAENEKNIETLKSAYTIDDKTEVQLMTEANILKSKLSKK